MPSHEESIPSVVDLSFIGDQHGAHASFSDDDAGISPRPVIMIQQSARAVHDKVSRRASINAHADPPVVGHLRSSGDINIALGAIVPANKEVPSEFGVSKRRAVAHIDRASARAVPA